MKIIKNSNEKINHCKIINSVIKDSDKLYIAVAFFKMSGLQLIKNQIAKLCANKTAILFVVGLDYYQTEPQALLELLELFKVNKNAHLYAHNKGKFTFHPKMYFSKKSGNYELIIGSGNLTRGGLEDNIEISLLESGKLTESLPDSIESCFMNFKKNSKLIENPTDFAGYENEYTEYHKIHKKAEKDFKEACKEIPILDWAKLDRYKEQYFNDENARLDYNRRELNYIKAKDEIIKIARCNFKSDVEFLETYNKLVGGKESGGEVSKFWHSGSIVRQKNNVAKDYKGFCNLTKSIIKAINSKTDSEIVFGDALAVSRKLKGVGVNIITEIMNTLDPDKFAVLNKNPIEALYKIGMKKFRNAQNFTVEDYKEFVGLLKIIQARYNLKNLGQADNLLNYIYWKEK